MLGPKRASLTCFALSLARPDRSYPDFDGVLADLSARKINIPAREDECGPRGWKDKDLTGRGCTKLFSLYSSTKHGTLEFRAAAGSADERYILSWLQFVIAFVEFFKDKGRSCLFPGPQLKTFDNMTATDVRALCAASEKSTAILSDLLDTLVNEGFLAAPVRAFFVSGGIRNTVPVDPGAGRAGRK